jgi:hypothetical protein
VSGLPRSAGKASIVEDASMRVQRRRTSGEPDDPARVSVGVP